MKFCICVRGSTSWEHLHPFRREIGMADNSTQVRSPDEPGEAAIDSQKLFTARVVGLAIALVLTTIFWWPAVAGRLLPDDLVWRNVAAQAVDWAFCLVLMGIVVCWERQRIYCGGEVHRQVQRQVSHRGSFANVRFAQLTPPHVLLDFNGEDGQIVVQVSIAAPLSDFFLQRLDTLAK